MHPLTSRACDWLASWSETCESTLVSTDYWEYRWASHWVDNSAGIWIITHRLGATLAICFHQVTLFGWKVVVNWTPGENDVVHI